MDTSHPAPMQLTDHAVGVMTLLLDHFNTFMPVRPKICLSMLMVSFWKKHRLEKENVGKSEFLFWANLIDQSQCLFLLAK